MTSVVPPVTAFAQFFDDIRMEITGKPILIGQYVGTLNIVPGTLVDRLAVLLTVRWPRSYTPTSSGIKISIPGQPPITQTLPRPTIPDSGDKPVSPFAAVTTQGILNLRFPPLRVGDVIDVWFEADGHNLPAGRLYVSDKPVSNESVFHASDPPTAIVT